jgi:cytochrome P450
MKPSIVSHSMPGERESDVSRAPGPKGLPVLGSIPHYFTQGFYRFLTPGAIRFRLARARLIAFMRHHIQMRREQTTRPADVLTQLLEARTAERPMGLSDEEMVDEAMTLIFAGSETIALALAWACYFLATEPQATQALRHELDSVLGGRLPTEADLAALSYTSWFWKEVLRARPPVGWFPREVLAEDTFDGAVVQPGDLVMCCPYLTHHDPHLWPNPEQFDPTQFDPEHAALAPYSYFPYGAGQRTCLGAAFANQEGVLVLASLAQCFELRLQPGFRPIPRAAGTLGLAHGMWMTIFLRTHPGTPECVPGLMRRRIETMKRWMSKPLDWVGAFFAWLLYTAIPKMQGRESKPFGPDR